MQSFYLDSSHFDLIIVSGPDAARFLQGQLTCDIETLGDGSFTYGAVCNNKGRVITPLLLCSQNQVFYVILDKNLREIFLGALNKFLPFYKCTIQPETSDDACMGLAGPAATTFLPASNLQIPIPGKLTAFTGGWLATLAQEPGQFLIYRNLNIGTPLLTQRLDGFIQDDGALWQELRMRKGHYPFIPEDSGQYTPQDLHYDRNGYVSFSKGCYTGQEIIARMHYRGKIKKQLYLATITSQDNMSNIENLILVDGYGKELTPCKKGLKIASNCCLALAELPLDFDNKLQTISTKDGYDVKIEPF